jgi:hypothetical protein
MLWRFVYILGGMSFISTGYSVLTDPQCQKVNLSGFRFFSVDCQAQSGSQSGLVVGLISILVGLVAVLLNVAILFQAFKNVRAGRNPDEFEPKEPPSAFTGESLASLIIFIFIILGISYTFVQRESHLRAYQGTQKNIALCKLGIDEVTKLGNQLKDSQNMIDATTIFAQTFLTEQNYFANLSNKATGKLKLSFSVFAMNFGEASTALTNNYNGGYDLATKNLASSASIVEKQCSSL